MGEHDEHEAGPEARGTRYVVLAIGDEPGSGWLPIGDYTARSAEAAVQAAAEQVLDDLARRVEALERAVVVQTGGDESPGERARRTFDAGGVAWGHEPADEALRWKLGVDRRTER